MRWIGWSILVLGCLGALWWYQAEEAAIRLQKRSMVDATEPSAPRQTQTSGEKLEKSGTSLVLSTTNQTKNVPPVAVPPQTKTKSDSLLDGSTRDERMKACADCHPEQVAGYLETPMGKSWAIPGEAEVTENFDPTKTTVGDPNSPLVYRTFRDDQGTYWQEEFHPNTNYRRKMKAAFVIGSGKRNRTYLGWLGNELVELPLTWYQQKGIWDLSPGYQTDNQRFNRRADAACLFCHNGLTPVVSSAFAQYRRPMAQGIDCRRCHGDATEHIQARLDGVEPPDGQPDPTIYNPAHEPPTRKQQVCDQCHLQGASRVLREGKSWQNYDPKTPLHEVAAIFLESESNTDGKPKFLDLPYRIALSPCGQAAEVTCVTCHNPHQKGTVESYRAACQSCHGLEGCSDKGGRRADAHCAGCHMQRQSMVDIPHARGVDHYIRRRPESLDDRSEQSPTGYLVHKYNDLRTAETTEDINLMAIGLFQAFKNAVGEDSEKFYAEEAMSKLTSVVVDGQPNWKSLNALAQLMGEQGHQDASMKLLRKSLELKSESEGLWMSLAIAAEKANDTRTTIEAYGKVNALLPNIQRALAGEGKARLKSGDERGGVALLDRADKVSDHDPTVAASRGELAVRKRNLEDAKLWFREAVKRDPLHQDSQLKLCGLLMVSRDLDGAERCVSEALQFNPMLSGLYWLRARARIAKRELLGARQDLVRLIEFDPKKVEVYGELARVEAGMGRIQSAMDTLTKARRLLGTHDVFDQVEREIRQPAAPWVPGPSGPR